MVKILLGICITPFIVYYCVKFGTVGFYKAKQLIEEEKNKN